MFYLGFTNASLFCISDGKLKQIDPTTNEFTENGYDFNVSSDPSHNQKRYEALGDIITEQVYTLLLDEGMVKHYLPDDLPKSTDSTFIFTNKNFGSSDKLMVLIHGSGVVRAGQWARRLAIISMFIKCI